MRSSSRGAPRPSDDPAQPIDAAWAHRDELVLYARRLLGARGDLAEDVVQEAFLRLHEHDASGSAIREPRPWLFRVIRNLALDERRRSRRGEDVRTSLEVVAAQPRGPLEVLQGREEARQALEGLGALPPREQRTVILDQAGLPPTAIARRMQTTTNAVHQSLFRARRRMRDARAAAWGLLPLPIIRLILRAASSPALEKLPAVAPGSGGRLAGGTGLAGLVAAAVIGGGVVVDQAVVPHPGHVRGGVHQVVNAAAPASPAPQASSGQESASASAARPVASRTPVVRRAATTRPPAARVRGARRAPARVPESTPIAVPPSPPAEGDHHSREREVEHESSTERHPERSGDRATTSSARERSGGGDRPERTSEPREAPEAPEQVESHDPPEAPEAPDPPEAHDPPESPEHG